MSIPRLSRIAAVAGSILLAGCLAGCSDGYFAAPTPRVVPVESLAAGPTALLLRIGQTKQLTAFVKDASGTVLSGRTVTWTTDSPDVALVSATGLVTATGPGYVTIVATCEGKTFGVAGTVVEE